MSEQQGDEKPPYVAPSPQGGRPTQFCEEVVKAIETRMIAGLSLSDAATLSGVDHSTACKWHQDGRKNPDSKYRQFFERVERARIKMKEQIVIHMSQLVLASPNVGDCIRVLERRFPAEWGPVKEQVDVNHSGAIVTGGGDPMLAGMNEGERAAMRAAFFARVTGKKPEQDEPDDAPVDTADILGLNDD